MHILMYATQLYIWLDVYDFYMNAVHNCEPQDKLKEMIDENVNDWPSRHYMDSWEY